MSGQKLEGLDVPRAHDGEVPAFHGDRRPTPHSRRRGTAGSSGCWTVAFTISSPRNPLEPHSIGTPVESTDRPSGPVQSASASPPIPVHRLAPERCGFTEPTSC